MADIKGDKMCISVIPHYHKEGGWWCYFFAFEFDGKNILNPEAVQKQIFKADEYKEGEFFRMIIEAAKCTEDGKEFYWSAWEDEITVTIRAHMKNLKWGKDGGFDFEVALDEGFFNGGSYHHSLDTVAVKVFADRRTLVDFIHALGNEIAKEGKR